MAQRKQPEKTSGRPSYLALKGAEQKPPYNIKGNDKIICAFPVLMGPYLQTQFCNYQMPITRYQNLYSPLRLKCLSCNKSIIPKSQYVAVCQNYKHTNSGLNIICCECIEMRSSINLIIPSTGINSRNSPLWYIERE